MNNVEIIGFVAGTLVAISVLPQVVKSWKTRSTKDVALAWSVINLTGQILWIIYGFYINSYSLVAMEIMVSGTILRDNGVRYHS